MIKPATPLAVLFFVAFVLLLLPTLSVPTIKAIPLATAPGKDNTIFTFGIFGWCGPSNCSGYHVGYSTDTIPGFDSNGDFNLPSGSRASLSAILIVHPIAALLALICAALAVTVHFRTAAHSPNFLLGLLIITFPTLLVALLAFLVDILLFVPHQQWPCYLELAGTIVITLCSVLTCAMRRTLVSRKARQRRIAENEDMNGSTYYSNKPQPPVFHDAPTYTREQAYARAESPPPLDPALENKLPRSAAFEAADDRTPLNAKEPSIRTNSTNGRSQRTPTATDASHTMVSSLSGTAPGGYGDQGRSPVSPLEGDVPPLPRGPIDARGAYSGPAGPRGGFGPHGGMPAPAMYGRGRGGLPPPRGGFAPRGGRGGYPPPGPPPPGAYGRGGYPPRGPFRGGPRGPPPPPGMRGGYPSPAGYMGRGGYPTGPQMPPTYATNETGYDDYIDSYADSTPQGPYGDARYADTPPLNHPNGPPQPLYSEPLTGYDAPPQHERVLPPPISSHTPPITQNDSITRDPASFGFSGPRAFSPRTATSRGGPTPPAAMPNHVDGPSGQAIEMDAMPRPPSATRESSAVGAYNASNVVELGSSTPRLATATPTAASELHSHAQGPSAHAAEPSPPQTRSRKSSDAYYEDVDPRFAHDEPLPNQETSGNVPPALVPGYVQSNPANAHLFPPKRQPSDASYYSERDVSGMNPALESEEIDRTRSPAQSDTSNFTSISQRGINPNWRPGPGEIAQGPPMGPPGNGPPRPMRGGPGYGPPQGRGRGVPTDALLNDNPDFALPGAGRGRPYHHARGNSGDGGRYPAAV